MKPFRDEHFGTIISLAHETPKIDDSLAKTTAKDVFDKAWEIAQKYGYNETNEANLISSYDKNIIYARVIAETYGMTFGLTVNDQSAILAIAEVHLMALSHPEVEQNTKETAIHNLREILGPPRYYHPTVLNPIREATKAYIQSTECPASIKAEYAEILEDYPTPNFETISTLLGGDENLPDFSNSQSDHTADDVFQIARSVAEKNNLNWSTVHNGHIPEDNSTFASTILETVHDFANKVLTPNDPEAQLADVEIQLSALVSDQVELDTRLIAFRNLSEYFGDDYNSDVSTIARQCVDRYILDSECPIEIMQEYNRHMD